MQRARPAWFCRCCPQVRCQCSSCADTSGWWGTQKDAQPPWEAWTEQLNAIWNRELLDFLGSFLESAAPEVEWPGYGRERGGMS